MKKDSKIYVAGHRGLVGSALVRCLNAKGYPNLLLRAHVDLDLEDRTAVQSFFAVERPDYVFLAAAKVGGIHANSIYPVDFLLRNLRIQNNVIEASHRFGAQGLLFLGSSCIYPKLAPQPLKEEYLLTGPLEPTNEPYAISKIAGISLCESYNRQYGTKYVSVMPTNLYGPADNYDLLGSHVLPALIRKFHLGKIAALGDISEIRRDELIYGRIPDDVATGLASIASAYDRPAPFTLERIGQVDPNPAVVLWGSGSPYREFLHSDDLASACVFLMERLDEIPFNMPVSRASDASQNDRALFNVGSGREISIRDLATLVASVVGFYGPIEWDKSKPDGTPRKLLDVSRLSALGWSPSIKLEEGIALAYRDYLNRLGGCLEKLNPVFTH
jgi:GDP-L-fucose synthase